MTMVPRIHLVQKPMVKMRIETKMVQKMSMTQNLSAYRKITLHPLLSRVMPMYKKRQKHALLMRRPNNRLVGLHSTTNRSYTSIFLLFFLFQRCIHFPLLTYPFYPFLIFCK